MQGGIIHTRARKGRDYKDECHRGKLQASRGNKKDHTKSCIIRLLVSACKYYTIYPVLPTHTHFGITKNRCICVASDILTPIVGAPCLHNNSCPVVSSPQLIPIFLLTWVSSRVFFSWEAWCISFLVLLLTNDCKFCGLK